MLESWDQELKSLWLEYLDRADLVLAKGRTVVMIWDWYVKNVDILRRKYVR